MRAFLILFAVLCALLVASPAAAEEANIAVPAEATVNGKYNELLKVLPCAKDEATYGKFKDYGKYPASKWCGQDAPEGFWVYSAPNWYIWKNDGGLPAQASVDGKYKDLLAVIPCAKDEATYGKFKDYGNYPATKWCGANAPAGFWVYVTPNWYIWAAKK